MKHALPALVLLLSASVAHAQLVNGSFEIDGQPSLEGWVESENGISVEPGGAPGGGSWHARIPFTLVDDPLDWGVYTELYQLLPGFQFGDSVTITYWAKVEGFVPAPDDSLQFNFHRARVAWLNSENVPMENGPAHWGTFNSEWQRDTIRGMVLTPGCCTSMLAFHAVSNHTEGVLLVDNIEMIDPEELSTSVPDVTPSDASLRYDPAHDLIVVTGYVGGTLMCFDASGRRADVPTVGSLNGLRTCSTASLAPGIYTVASGTRTLRFVKQ